MLIDPLAGLPKIATLSDWILETVLVSQAEQPE
jgi:hypothetical protein